MELGFVLDQVMQGNYAAKSEWADGKPERSLDRCQAEREKTLSRAHLSLSLLRQSGVLRRIGPWYLGCIAGKSAGQQVSR
jgi:hypothetical protein